MKLRTKIAIACAVLLTLTVLLCSGLQMWSTRNALLEQCRTAAEEKLQSIETGFWESLGYYISSDSSEAAITAVAHYAFRPFSSSENILLVNGKAQYTNRDMKPESFLPLEEGERGQTICQTNGRDYLITGVCFVGKRMYPNSCTVYIVQDITDIYGQIWQMTLEFLLVGLLCALLGAVGIGLLVRKSLLPLSQLEQSAAHIAEGNYDRRVETASRDEVGALAESFNAMAQAVQQRVEELTETARRQQLFIGGVTHEFKTPLTGILLNVDSLQNVRLGPEQQEAALSRIENQAQWLEQLVQKLLKLLTLEQQVEKTTLSSRELLETVAGSVAEVLQQRELQIKVEGESFDLSGDGDLLRSALMNLIDNAAKASKPGQIITLHSGNRTITVSDSGKGIPPEALPHVTEPFYMADRSRSKRQGGAGLGLALVQQIAKAHGASLEIESQPGVGTVVRIRFPERKE